MKSKTKITKPQPTIRPAYMLTLKSLMLALTILIGIQTSLKAQEVQFTKPSWWFGVAGAANFNFSQGSTQNLDGSFAVPTTFHDAYGVGIYAAPLIEFHAPGSHWGMMLQAGYDSRRSKFNQVITPCHCPADLSTDLSYLTVEPSLRYTPFGSNFYLYGGPRFAYAITQAYTYKLGINPAFPDQTPTPDVTGDFSNVNKMQLSMQVGAGYDIALTSLHQRMQWVLSPFVSYHPYFGQDPRTVETWNMTTVRAGAALKLGRGHNMAGPPKVETLVIKDDITIPEVQFTIIAPKNIPTERRVREIFPVRNYVFFDIGSTQIPDRYVLLRKDQVKDFKEDQLEVFTPKTLSGRSDRQMIVYYNVLNILGDRMMKNPTATITLVGSSEKGSVDGRAMAESIRQYLINVFGIQESRIAVEGQGKPDIPSEQPGGTRELTLLREGDRRVSIESTSPALLMEFQSGHDAPLRPVEIVAMQEAPLDSYVTFDVKGGREAFSSWTMEIRDEKGAVNNYGPYTEPNISLPGKSILGTTPEGNFHVTLIGTAHNGTIVKKETNIHIVLWTPPQNEEGMRYSVIYEFNNAKAIAIYDKYLTEIVAPKIPVNATVMIHGHTDVIGDEAYNMNLSLARANDVKAILDKSLATSGRTDVKIEVFGFGEDENLAPFDNKYPEERFYNRTVIIDIIPHQ